MRRWLTRGSEARIDEIAVGSAEDFRAGSSKIVFLGDEKVIIARSETGAFHAVSGVCTHLGCSIRFDNVGSRTEFACNCHDSRFDLEGINMSGPARSPLTRFEVRLSGRELLIARSVDSDGS